MTDKEKIIDLIETVKQDCQSQVDALEQTNDVAWNCYDIPAWQYMVEFLDDAIELINKPIKCTKPLKIRFDMGGMIEGDE
jgi:hypothetical protein